MWGKSVEKASMEQNANDHLDCGTHSTPLAPKPEGTINDTIHDILAFDAGVSSCLLVAWHKTRVVNAIKPFAFIQDIDDHHHHRRHHPMPGENLEM